MAEQATENANSVEARRFQDFICPDADMLSIPLTFQMDHEAVEGTVEEHFTKAQEVNSAGGAIRLRMDQRRLYVTDRYLELDEIESRLSAAAIEPALIVNTGRGFEVYWNTAPDVLTDQNFYSAQWFIARGVLSNGEKEIGTSADYVFVPGFTSYDAREPFQVEIVYENPDAPALNFAQIKQRAASEEDRKQHTEDEQFKLRPLSEREPEYLSIPSLCNEWVWVVGIERFVWRRNPARMWKVTQFDSVYNNLPLPKGVQSISKYLFKGPILKRFERMVYAPGKGEHIGRFDYNSYRAPPINPRPGDTKLWNEHLLYLFPKGVADEEREAVLNWMAWVLQNPTKKPNQALLIVGRNTGTGKSYLARMMEAMVGPANTQRPKNSSLGGDFNAWILSCRLCIIEELMQTGRREVANALREVITEPTIEVNIKGISAYKVDNFIATMGSTNHPDALPTDETDRRWLAAGVPDNVAAKDKAYYDRLFADTLDNPDGLAAVYYELLHRPLNGWAPRGHAIMTEAKREMIRLSRTDLETWLDDERDNDPLNRSFINIRDDIVPHVPAHIARSEGKGLEKNIAKWLRPKLNGTRLRTVRINGRVVSLWAVNEAGAKVKAVGSGPSPFADGEIAATYLKEQKAGGRLSDAQAPQDFAEGGDEADFR